MATRHTAVSPTAQHIASAPRTRRPMLPSVAESYQLCGQIVRRASTNFFLSFWLLPAAQRRAMSALYAFARYTDDLGDSDESADQRAACLQQWRKTVAGQLDAALLAGEPALFELLASIGPDELKLGERLLPALIDSVWRFQIPTRYLLEIIDGVLLDTTQTRYATFAELDHYCYHVASAVGLACLHIWQFTDHAAIEPAKQCGLAFQLTNILRDIKEDAERGRIYLPAEDLTRFNYAAHELQTGVCDQRFRELIQFQVARAERCYQAAAATANYLPRDGRRMFAAMFNTYRALLKKIGRHPEQILRRRARLNLPHKLAIVADSCLRGVRVNT